MIFKHSQTVCNSKLAFVTASEVLGEILTRLGWADGVLYDKNMVRTVLACSAYSAWSAYFACSACFDLLWVNALMNLKLIKYALAKKHL